MSDCIFCKIINNEIPSTRVYEDEFVIGFKDLNPLAKEHYLFIHRDHSENINDITDSDPAQLSDVFKAISKFTKDSGLASTGFRVVTNQGVDGGQTVFHTHFHVLGGEKLAGFGS